MTQLASAATAAPIPPQSLEAEENVLGAMLISTHAVDACLEVLSPADFYRESHAKIYRAAAALHTAGRPVDAVTLVDELDLRGELDAVGGRVRVHELAALVPATANVAHHARIVREMALLRGLIRAGGEIARYGWERPDDVHKLVEHGEALMFELAQQRSTRGLVPVADAMRPVWERIVERAEGGRSLVGVPSGFKPLDDLTSGFQPGNLVVLAARPSVGKSALALGIVNHVALHQGMPVALFTLEMNEGEVVERILSMEALVDSQRIRNGTLTKDDWKAITVTAGRVERAPLWIDDSGLITMAEIRSKARRMKTRHPDLALIVIDYLQLMTSGVTADNRNQEMSQISRALKVLAGELRTPVVALSQLSRQVEQRHDKRPILSDLRDCLAADQKVYDAQSGRWTPISELAADTVSCGLGDGWKQRRTVITEVWAKGHQPVLKLRTRTGRELRATANHPVRTIDGWVAIDNLTPGSKIAVPRHLPAPTLSVTGGVKQGAFSYRLLRRLRDLAGSDVLWDEVTSVVADGEDETYDFRAPTTGNVVAGGIYCHNSGSIEQDADLVLFVYRDEYYNPENADELGTAGVAEINLAKQRNGPTGTVKLAFARKFAKFTEIAPPGLS